MESLAYLDNENNASLSETEDKFSIDGSDNEIAETNYVAPRNETEQILARIWSDVLGIDLDSIGIEHNFFEIGGHSLAAATVAQHIRKTFNKNVTIRSVFENPRIVELSQMLLQADVAKASKAQKSPKINPKAAISPILNRQLLSWLLKCFKKAKTSNVSEIFTIEGSLAIELFQSAASEVAKRHDSLFHAFSPKKPLLKLGKPVKTRVELIDISGRSEKEHEELLRQAIDKVFNTPFDLSKTPLFRIALAKKDNATYFLLISLPHIVSDYASINSFVTEIFDLYAQKAAGMDLGRPVKSSLVDMVNDEIVYVQSNEFVKNQNFWKDKLEDAEFLKLKKEYFLTNEKPTGKKLLTKIKIDRAAIERFKKLAAETNSSLQMIILTLIKATLHSLSGQNDISITMIMDARGIYSANAPVINLNVASITVRSRFVANQTYLDLLAHIKQFVIEAHEHMRFPFCITMPINSVLQAHPVTAWLARISTALWAWRYRKARLNKKVLYALVSYFFGIGIVEKKIRKQDKNLRLAPTPVYNVMPNFYENRLHWSSEDLRVVNLRERELIMPPEVFNDDSEYYDSIGLNMDLTRDKNDDVYLYLWGGGFNEKAHSEMRKIFERHMECMLANPSSALKE